MIGGGGLLSRNSNTRNSNTRNSNKRPRLGEITRIDYNLKNIKDSIDNNKINTILKKLSNIIKNKIKDYKIVFNPINIEKYEKIKIDYKDIIELYLLNGHDAKKDFENVPNVFTKNPNEKQYDYFKNYIIFEYYIIFYNLMKDNNDRFKLNIVTRKLAEYMSDLNYNGKIKTFFNNYINNINNNTNIEESLINVRSIENRTIEIFRQVSQGQVSDVEFFVVIALDDFRFNQEYTSFNVLNHLYSNLKNDAHSNIQNKNSNQYTIFKLYDAQNNAKTQSSNLEINSFGDEDYIKQVVLLSNFIDAGNISSDALNRLQDYKKYIPQYNIDNYKREVHNNFIKLCKIFTLRKDANIKIVESYNDTNVDVILEENDSNNILDIFDPATINFKKITQNINTNYKISLKIDEIEIFDITIKNNKLQNYINEPNSQYLEYKIKNYNNINTIASTIRDIKVNDSFSLGTKQKEILKLLNLKALGDFSHCIFLKIFKTYFNETQTGSAPKRKREPEKEIIDVYAIKNIQNKKNLEKLRKLFYFNENKTCYLFRYNSREIDINFYENLLAEDIKKNILPVKYLTINNTKFLNIEKEYLHFKNLVLFIYKINNGKFIQTVFNLNDIIKIKIDADILNLLYNFFYILCDDLENPKNPIKTKDKMKEEINKYINVIKSISNINIQEYNNYIKSIIKFNDYINNNIQKYINQLNQLNQNNFYIIGILNILMKVYLYDELLFIIMARKFYSTFIKKNTNPESEDELINDLIKLYKEINIKNTNNIKKEDYINKVKKYFSISQQIEDKLSNNGNSSNNTNKISQLDSERNYISLNNTRKMFMISTVDNLLKTYCLANDLSFSVDGVTIIYNN
jgi:hypothetical protein